jgi:hypothetical protein
MGGIEQALGQADAPPELAYELDQLVVGVGDRCASDGAAVEEIQPYRLRAGRVHVDDVATFEVGLQATEAEEQIEDGPMQGRLLFGGGRRDAAAYQVVGVTFEHLVDEFGPERLLIRSRESRLPASLALALPVGQRLRRL